MSATFKSDWIRGSHCPWWIYLNINNWSNTPWNSLNMEIWPLKMFYSAQNKWYCRHSLCECNHRQYICLWCNWVSADVSSANGDTCPREINTYPYKNSLPSLRLSPSCQWLFIFESFFHASCWPTHAQYFLDRGGGGREGGRNTVCNKIWLLVILVVNFSCKNDLMKKCPKTCLHTMPKLFHPKL